MRPSSEELMQSNWQSFGPNVLLISVKILDALETEKRNSKDRDNDFRHLLLLIRNYLKFTIFYHIIERQIYNNGME